MGNDKISITAELVSIIRSKNDSKYLYFVSPKAQKIYNLAKKLISDKKLKEIFDWRIKLSQAFDEKILSSGPELIIELGCGYSLRGFNLCLADDNLVYIDTDLEGVISQKRRIFEIICKKENIDFPKNYHLVSLDVLHDDLFGKMRQIISVEKKILVIAEGLTSYFSDSEFRYFLKHMRFFLNKFSNCEFYSNESVIQPKGIAYKILRSLIALLTGTINSRKLRTAAEFERYLNDVGISNYKIEACKFGFILYSMGRN